MRLLCGLVVLGLAACATGSGPGSRAQSPAHAARLIAPVERLWIELADVYRALGIPIAEERRETWTVRSGNVVPYEVRIFGGTGTRYFWCSTDLGSQPALGSRTYVVVSTKLEPDGAGTKVRSRVSASVTQVGGAAPPSLQECTSTGVLETRILRALDSRT